MFRKQLTVLYEIVQVRQRLADCHDAISVVDFRSEQCRKYIDSPLRFHTVVAQGFKSFFVFMNDRVDSSICAAKGFAVSRQDKNIFCHRRP